MFKPLSAKFNESPSCYFLVDPKHFQKHQIECFDNDGFELSILEQNIYLENNFKLQTHLNHYCLQQKWMELEEGEFIMDHCLLLERKDFQGELKNQLAQWSKRFPQLQKYLKVKPKWGYDMALEYFGQGVCLEVLHIEYDFHDYEEAEKNKEVTQKRIIDTDWKDFVTMLLKKKSDWEHLQGMEQNNYKAKLWGLNKAEGTLKSFN